MIIVTLKRKDFERKDAEEKDKRMRS